MTSRTWMPLYIADYLADTSHLGALQSGAYLHLIMHYWQHGALPDNDAALARIAKLSPAEWKRERATLAAFFQNGWTHKRVAAELADATAIISAKSTAGKAGAAARWQEHAKKDAPANAPAIANASGSHRQTDAPSPSTYQEKEVPPELNSSDASASGEAESPASASSEVDSLPAGDLQDFWRIAGALESRKLARSRAGQLLNLLGPTEALEAIRGAERSRNPGAYVGKTIDSVRKERAGPAAPAKTNGSMPPWIAARKNEGHAVQREGKHWRVDWALYDDTGECIGS